MTRFKLDLLCGTIWSVIVLAKIQNHHESSLVLFGVLAGMYYTRAAQGYADRDEK